MRPTRLLPLACLLVATLNAAAFGTTGLPYADAEDAERQMIDRMLGSDHWPFRVFALLRLERYRGEDVGGLVAGKLGDEAWAVRTFAVRTAARLGHAPAPEAFASETDGRVVRAALRHGIRLPPNRITPGIRALLATPALDELLLGVELAALTDIEALRTNARGRVTRLIRNMDDAVAIRVSRPLARGLGVTGPHPATRDEWHAWMRGRTPDTLLAPPPAPGVAPPAGNAVAELEPEAFSRLIGYLDALRQRDLDLAIAMDSTASMVPMINATRAGVESLILFLDHISRTLRLGFVAYRDHDNPPVWEGHPFTSDVDSIREFLFGIRITGGADLPEAVLDGLTACGQLDWNRDATREIILVGDARPHEDDEYKLTGLLESYASAGVTVHAVHVPQQPNPDYLARLDRPRAVRYRQEIAEHNLRTEEAFAAIARLGGGERVQLTDATELVPAIMHLTIEETWWSVFDAFYAMYLDLCR
ncbi:MAG: VWA domain-containing protein [Phycisphaerales bacterium]|nr:VWA domain-containing protein [Phycisphaerales bacterium]